MSVASYVSAINAVKAYLDPYWSGSANCYEISSDYPGIALTDGTPWRPYVRCTWGNAWMLQTTAILAGYDAANGTSYASATDKTRAISIANNLTGQTSPSAYDGAGNWFHQMDGVDYRHESLNANVAEALFYAYKYRSALGWTGTGTTAALTILTSSNTMLSFSTASGLDNQNLAYWQFNVLAFRYLSNGTTTNLANCIKTFVDNMDRPYNAGNPGFVKNGVLYPDFGWKYTDAQGPFPSWEYGSMSLGGALVFYPELASTIGLTTTQQDRLKAWSRHILGQWQLNGYPNWDTSFSNSRLHSFAYWMHGIRSLVAIARNDGYLNQNPGDAAIAKGILDRLVSTTFPAMDTLRSDAADGAVPAWPIGVNVFSGYHPGRDETTSFAKWSFNAKYIATLALAIELDVAGQAASTPTGIFTWHWDRQALHVSTPNYSVGILPLAPAIGTSYTQNGVAGTETSNGADAVQLQHWGPSHIQTPDNRWFTALGGYGEGRTFSAVVRRNGATEIDTTASTPTTRSVYRDGVQVNPSKTAYSTTAIPTTFDATLRHVASKNATNYSLTVDTTCKPDRIETTYTVNRIGTAGTVTLTLGLPSRNGATVKASDGSTLTTIWNGTSAATKANVRYLHQTFGSYGAVSVVEAVGCTVSASMYGSIPAAVYDREVDRSRTALVTADMGSLSSAASVRITTLITNGTDADAGIKAGLAGLLTVDPLSPTWSQSGTNVTVFATPGVSNTATATVTSQGGTLRFTGTNAARFTASLDGSTYTSTLTIPTGTSTVYLNCTPNSNERVLTTKIGVPS